MTETEFNKLARQGYNRIPLTQREAVKQGIARLIEGDMQGLDIARLLPHPKEYRLRAGKVRILFGSSRDRLFIFIMFR